MWRNVHGDNGEAHANMGFALQQTGHISEVREQFEQALRIDPNDPQIQSNLAALKSLPESAPTKN